MKLFLNQKGLAPIIAILIGIIIAGGAGLGAYFALQSIARDNVQEITFETGSEINPVVMEEETVEEQPAPQNLSYQYDGKTFVYPSNWKLVENVYTTPAGVSGIVSITLKPLNQLNQNDYITYGGRQTSCINTSGPTLTRVYCFLSSDQGFYAIPAQGVVTDSMREASIPMFTESSNLEVLEVFEELVQTLN